MPITNPQQQLRYERFANLVFLEGQPASRAYAQVFDTDPASQSTQASASRLLRRDEVKQYAQGLSDTFLNDSLWAYERQKQLAQDPRTPAHVRNAVFESILSKAGFGKINETEIAVTKRSQPTIDASLDELHQWIKEAQCTPMITRLCESTLTADGRVNQKRQTTSSQLPHRLSLWAKQEMASCLIRNEGSIDYIKQQ